MGTPMAGSPNSTVQDPVTGNWTTQYALDARKRREQEARDATANAKARGDVPVINTTDYSLSGSGNPSGGGSGYSAAGGSGSGGGTAYSAGVVSNAGEGGGNINLSRGSYEDQQAMLLRAKLANDAFGRVSGSTSGGASPTVQYGGANADAARAATFARAKEQAGMNAGAALKSLQDVMGSRGLHGSTIEGDLTNEAISGGRGDIANSITNQLNEELGQQQHVTDTTYAGGFTQRGQDMNAKQTMLSILAGLY